MQKIIMLGTGHGFVYNYNNTCFILQNDEKYFMIDTGGSTKTIENLQKSNINIEKIHDIFISHCHTDHILGLFWMLKKITGLVKNNIYKGKLNIYCNKEVADSIKNIYPYLFPNTFSNIIKEYLNIIILDDNDKKIIAGREYTFFDVKARKNLLYGFETTLDNDKRFIFLGDETCNQSIYNKIKDADYVMHEAFCLDQDQKIFKPYEKNHSTVKSVCQSLENLNIKNLILFHTEETHIQNRKVLYIEEGKKYFSNNILVPNELETIELD